MAKATIGKKHCLMANELVSASVLIVKAIILVVYHFSVILTLVSILTSAETQSASWLEDMCRGLVRGLAEENTPCFGVLGESVPFLLEHLLAPS